MISAGGGRTNAYPSRSYPQGEETDARSFQGGARGPAAIPSRVTTFVLPAAPSMVGGAEGPIREPRRGPVWAGPKYSPGNQELGQVDNTYQHETIPWSRPVYDNTDGARGYLPPTALPSWSANATADPGGPASAVPFDRKRIDNFTQREEFGSSRQLFRVLSDPNTRRPDSGRNLQLRRGAAQARTANPWQPLLTRYGLSGSYGSTTKTLPTQPQNAPATTGGPFGSY